MSPNTELYLGAGYDSNAAPDLGVDPSLFDMDKLSAALGARISLLDQAMRLGLTFTQVFYFTRDIEVVTNDAGSPNNGYSGVSGGPSAAGEYAQSVSVANGIWNILLNRHIHFSKHFSHVLYVALKTLLLNRFQVYILSK